MRTPTCCLAATVLFALSACNNGTDAGAEDVSADLQKFETAVAETTPVEVVPDAGPDVPSFELPSSPLEPVLFADELPSTTEGLAFDGKGYMYLSAMDGNVYRADSEGAVEKFAELLPVDEGVNGGCAGIAAGPDDALYVSRFDASRIERVPLADPDGVSVFLNDVDAPNTIVFRPDGSMWFTASGAHNQYQGYIGRLAAGAQEPEIVLPDVKYANGLAFSPAGDMVYFTSSDPGSLHRVLLDDDGKPGTPELLSDDQLLTIADGLAVAGDGTVFVAGWATGKILAWAGGEIVTVAELPDKGMLGTASLAFGQGPGFSSTALYATNLVKPQLFVVELGVP